ncbi:hypothetical protein Leryth_008686 [Lithospermum erythrorhizon]|nr:hypothetical protein Leryth_008686 [Lithospermum erythrorhizon]
MQNYLRPMKHDLISFLGVVITVGEACIYLMNKKRYSIPLQKQSCISAVVKPGKQPHKRRRIIPRKILVTEVPKYTMRLDRFQISSLGTTIGSTLDA